MTLTLTAKAEKTQPHFALNIARRGARLSLLQLADRADVDYMTVVRIELGLTQRPQEETKHRIADALQARVLELNPDTDEKVTAMTLWP